MKPEDKVKVEQLMKKFKPNLNLIPKEIFQKG